MSVISFKNIKSLSELKKTNYIWQIKNDKDDDKSLSFFWTFTWYERKMQFFCQMCENSILEPDTLVLGILDIITDIILEIVNAYMYKR